MISIKSLSKSYGSKAVLKDINLELKSGQVHGIVGQNGAGKTTLFRCLAGLETHEGSITSDLPNLKGTLGYFETNPIFLSRITGWEYLKLLCIARNNNREDFAEQNIFGLPLHQYAETYSTGMKKKLALTGLLLQGNKTLILDEPFNGVDIHSNMLITKLISMLKEKEKMILISSHIYATLAETCDYISILENGHIARTVARADFKTLGEELGQSMPTSTLDGFGLL